MKTSDNGKNVLKAFEGFRAEIYADVGGRETIGYGHCLTHKEIETGEYDRRLSKDEASDLMDRDLINFEIGINQHVKVPLTQNQFDALICFVYNLGLGNLYSSTLLRELNSGNYKKAADEFLRWNHVGGKVCAGVTHRREKERELFLS